MEIDILKYLENDYKELYSLGKDIDSLVFISPHSVILKSRVFIELLSKEIANYENMEELNSLNLAERLSKLKFADVFPNDINDYFFQIRVNANKAAHEAIEGELQIALSIHKYIFKIICWFIETYVDYNFNAPLYKDPLPNSKNKEIKEESNLLTKLMVKVESLIHSNKKNEEKTILEDSNKDDEKEIAEKEQEEKKKIQKEWDSVNKRTKTIPKNQGTKKDSEVHPKEAAEQEEKHISKKKSKDSGQMSLFDMMQPKES